MKAQAGIKVDFYSFFTSGARCGVWFKVLLNYYTHPGERDRVPNTQEAGWVPRLFWTGAGKLDPTGIRSPDRPPCSKSTVQNTNRMFLDLSCASP
jgi:hypothetical protein